MENVLIGDSSLNEYFKIEFENQNLNDNPSYLMWKESMISLNGNDTKFVKCKYDNIIFSCTKKSLRKNPIYQSRCPVCKKDICYYCSIHFDGECCIKRMISRMFLQDGFIYINPIIEEHAYTLKYYKAFILFILPFFNLLMLIVGIHCLLFYNLIKKTNHGQNDYEYYEEFMRNRFYIFVVFVFINTVFDVLITVPFILFNIYFNVLLLVISLPFKNYPLNYYLGITYGKYSF